MAQNIYFTTNVHPYWWRGIAADASVFFLTGGMISLFFLPRQEKALGWIFLGIGVLLIFLGSRAVLNPTSLWQFCLSFGCFVGGFRLFSTGRLNF
ncbi:MAG: hypothetical protein HC940_10235 [Acaryochloris sp. SU_5_25]|nr:hypothetical protein [Acaryochloris sp. SU_5_25]